MTGDALARRVVSLPFRLAVTLGLLAALALSIDWPTVGSRVSGGQWGWFAAAVAGLTLALVPGALRWHELLRAASLPVARSTALRAFAFGTFANSVLPTSFGGDAARAWMVPRNGHGLARPLTSVVVDRLSALACLFAIAWAALAADPASVPASLVTALAAVSLAGLVAGVVGALALRQGPASVSRLLPGRLRPFAGEARQTLLAYGRDRPLLVRLVALGLVYQALAVATLWCVSRAIDLRVEPSLLAVIAPLVLVITVMPVSVAGFGVREGGWVLLLGQAGVGAGEAALLSLLSVAALTLGSLPGALPMLARRRSGGLAESPGEVPR